MSQDSGEKARMSKGRFRLLLVVLLVASIIVVALVGAPFVAPFTVSKVTYTQNAFVPVTANGGFELNDNSWAILTSNGTQAVASIVSGGASSGNRSLYIHDPGQSVSVWYNDSATRVLPMLINSSVAFGFDLLFKGTAIPQGGGTVWLTLFLSWRLLPNDTFPLTLVLGNYSIYSDSTYDSVNASAGIIMLRGVRSYNTWNHYDLQLGTIRVDQLIKGYLLANSSTLYNLGDPIYVLGFRIAVDNADAYFDNVALCNVIPSIANVEVSKSTLLPSYVSNVTLNGYSENYTVAYGLTTDTVTFPMDIPLAFNGTYQISIRTGWGGRMVYNIWLNDSSLPTWV
ncbi:MAG TPA: hypothetical protein VMS77_04125 [Conexivisphaerales archaeon]|nr:hypothetical protein [Conexivisphaerales archaeon]